MNTNGKRITYKRARANPLFQDWLKELHEEAKEKRSKLEPMLKVALHSLSKYPLPLHSGAECAILKGFKKQLCKFIDRRLEVFKRNLSLQPNNSECRRTQICSGIINPTIQMRSNTGVKRITSTVTSASIGSSENDENFRRLMSGDPSGVVMSTSNSNSHHNINNNLCQIPSAEELQRSASQYNEERGPGSNIPHMSLKNPINEDSQSSSTPMTNDCGLYKPLPRSGGHAILIALLEHTKEKPNEPYLTKEALIDKAQRYCNESFISHKSESFYTAWCSVSRLEAKGLVRMKKYRKNVYSLTDAGLTLANELLEDSKNVTINVAAVTPEGVPSAYSNEHSGNYIEMSQDSEWKPEMVEMPAGSFDIILLIDKNETGGASRRHDPKVDYFKNYHGIKYEYRSLKVGDYTWIARHKVYRNQELVLPYIVERKRMDDLAASIKDGRFHEQKFRLRKCGLANVIYMVENYGSNRHLGLPLQTLKQALTNTRIQDEFKIHVTNSLADSAKFLAMMTNRVTMRFRYKDLRGTNYETNEEDLMTFNFFNKASSKTKTLTVTETFIKMLLQLKGLSVEKALAITNKYKTPKNLIEAYKVCQDSEGCSLLANLKYGDLNRNVGPNISNIIYLLFAATTDGSFIDFI